MRPEFEKYSAIDSYLSGKLTEQENAAFEKSMAEDSALREEVFDRKVVNEIIIEKRYFEIAAKFTAAPVGIGALLSKSVVRYVGIGAALTVILFTPYYFSKKSEPAVETNATPEQKIETPEVLTPTVVEEATPALPEQDQAEVVVVETAEEPVKAVEPVTVKVQKGKTLSAATKVEAKKKKAKADKSYVLEIPIDDPSAKGYHDNSYSFSPAKGQNWNIPVKAHTTANIKIFNNQGDEVYSAVLEKDKKHSWKGLANDGTKQKAGKYVYVLDFGKGDIQHGHVTIVR